MLVQKIIQESIAKNPVQVKEAFAEELRTRIAEALAEKIEEFQLSESDLDEAVEVSHDRYLRSHGKKASGIGGWFFTHKSGPVNNLDDNKEVYFHQGKFSDAAKSAKEWGKKNGHRSVYVMEEVEQIDEISKSTLASYIKKAGGTSLNSAGAHMADYGGHGSWKSYKKGINRAKGVMKAVDKLTKEEVEQIDELSKNTLGSYIKKASMRAAYKSNHAGEIEGRDKISPAAKKTLSNLNRKTMNSLDGIARATNRLTKEEVEQIDEAGPVVTHKWYSVKHWEDGSDHFDNLDDHLHGHDYKHAALGNTSRKRPDHHIGIPVKAKSAIAYMDKHAKLVE